MSFPEQVTALEEQLLDSSEEDYYIIQEKEEKIRVLENKIIQLIQEIEDLKQGKSAK
jgi:hypothetical protein